MMDEVRNNWNDLDDKEEIEIIEKYASIINVFTIIATRKRKKRTIPKPI